MWFAKPKNSREIFVSASLALQSPLLPSTLVSASKSAWQQLRYEIPDLVLNGVHQRDGKAYLQYHTSETQDDVSRWVERTTAFDFEEHRSDFEDLREKAVQKKRGRGADNVFLFSHAEIVGGGCLPVSSIQLILYVDHQVTDGIGARILLGRYLLLLASSIITSSNPPDCKFNWEEGYKQLSLPWICLMNENQALSGVKYEETVLLNQDILTKKMVE
jgi:hypothetical protein